MHTSLNFRWKQCFLQLKHFLHFPLGSKFNHFAVGRESKNELSSKTRSLETSSCATSELHRATPNIHVLWRGYPPSLTLVTRMTEACDKSSHLIQKLGNREFPVTVQAQMPAPASQQLPQSALDQPHWRPPGAPVTPPPTISSCWCSPS